MRPVTAAQDIFEVKSRSYSCFCIFLSSEIVLWWINPSYGDQVSIEGRLSFSTVSPENKLTEFASKFFCLYSIPIVQFFGCVHSCDMVMIMIHPKFRYPHAAKKTIKIILLVGLECIVL